MVNLFKKMNLISLMQPAILCTHAKGSDWKYTNPLTSNLDSLTKIPLSRNLKHPDKWRRPHNLLKFWRKGYLRTTLFFSFYICMWLIKVE